jgi:hypothetical protein
MKFSLIKSTLSVSQKQRTNEQHGIIQILAIMGEARLPVVPITIMSDAKVLSREGVRKYFLLEAIW